MKSEKEIKEKLQELAKLELSSYVDAEGKYLIAYGWREALRWVLRSGKDDDILAEEQCCKKCPYHGYCEAEYDPDRCGLWLEEVPGEG